jgi:ribosomal protein L40E
MQFAITCRKCGQSKEVGPKILGCIVKCPRCATESVLRPAQAT